MHTHTRQRIPAVAHLHRQPEQLLSPATIARRVCVRRQVGVVAWLQYGTYINKCHKTFSLSLTHLPCAAPAVLCS